jgi:hypothetical protein
MEEVAGKQTPFTPKHQDESTEPTTQAVTPPLI